MTFRSLIVALFALVLIAAPASAAEHKFGLTSFDTIRVEGDYIVEVTDSTRVSATASGDRDALEALDIEIRDRTLVIRRKQFGRWGSENGVLSPVVIHITAAGLTSASLDGGGSLLLRGIDGAQLNISMSGPGRLDAEGISIDRLSVRLEGAGSMTLAGEARDVTARVEGSGRMDAKNLTAKSLDLSSAGSAAASFSASRDAVISPRGVGRIEIFGTAPCKLKGKGTGNLTCEHGAPLQDG